MGQSRMQNTRSGFERVHAASVFCSGDVAFNLWRSFLPSWIVVHC